jgi:hypothetical protein
MDSREMGWEQQIKLNLYYVSEREIGRNLYMRMGTTNPAAFVHGEEVETTNRTEFVNENGPGDQQTTCNL